MLGKRNKKKSQIKRIGLYSFLLVTVLLATAFAVENDEGFSGINPDRAMQASQQLTQLQSEYPALRAYKTGSMVTRLYGTAFETGVSPSAVAEKFLMTRAGLFGIEPENLIPGRPTNPDQTSQQVMYNKETDSYKFTLLYYHQVLDGVPVYNAELRLLVRNEVNYPLVLAASSLHDLNNFTADKSAVVGPSAGAENAARADEPGLTDFSVQKTMIWAGTPEVTMTPTIAVVFEGESDFPERFKFIVDPVSGEIIHKDNLIIFEDVVGSVSGMATPGPKAMQCETEIATPFPHAYVYALGGSSTYADDKGEFVLPNSGTADVTIVAPVRGQYFSVFNHTGTDYIDTLVVSPPGPADFLMNELNYIEQVRAQMNGYVNANEVRDWTLTYNPTYPTVYTQTGFPVYVNRTDGYCPGNAWYDGSSINFCLAGDGYGNTAFASVSQHEYGHHLVGMAGSGQGQYGEGMSDCVAMLIADDPGLGYGFYESQCNTPLRNADNTYQYPCTGEIHDCGQLISGCVWDTRNELLITEPDNYLAILSNLTVNSILLHTGTEITPQITIDFLTLDDDDANIDNGTPHYDEINAGFSAHNMPAPELVPLAFDYPLSVPDVLAPLEETTLEVNISGQGSGEPVSGSGKLYYSVDGGAYTEVAMTENTTNNYEAVIPAMECYGIVTFYFSGEADGIGTFYNPDPSTPFQAIVATELIPGFSDDFNSNNGWTVSGSVSDGPWERGVPVGGGDRGDPPTDYDGSGYCYLTDNVDDNSDVDDGTTILTSPMIDLTDVGNAKISYARWYSNNAGDDPYNDIFEVYITDNDGTTWIPVEVVGPVDDASGGWIEHSFFITEFISPTNTVKIRFDASDLGSGSVVEAGLDAFAITTYNCVEPIQYICGDADNNELGPNVADLTFLVDYIFKSGEAPTYLEACDVDGVAEITVADLVFLVDYIFKSGPAPECE